MTASYFPVMLVNGFSSWESLCLALPVKAGQKTHGSVARSARLSSGSARLVEKYKRAKPEFWLDLLSSWLEPARKPLASRNEPRLKSKAGPSATCKCSTGNEPTAQFGLDETLNSLSDSPRDSQSPTPFPSLIPGPARWLVASASPDLITPRCLTCPPVPGRARPAPPTTCLQDLAPTALPARRRQAAPRRRRPCAPRTGRGRGPGPYDGGRWTRWGHGLPAS